MRIRVAVFGAFFSLAAVNASAQTCLGLPSFADAPYQASGGVSFTEGAQGFGVGGALGSENVFVGATLGVTNVDATDSSATSFAANVGASFVLHERERIEACPVAAVIVSGGPDIGEIDVSGVGLRAGGRIGVVAVESGNLGVVPTFGLDIAYDRVKGDVGDIETTIARETYAIVRVGAGFIWKERIAVLPLLGLPLGRDDDVDPEFSLMFTYAFGR